MFGASRGGASRADAVRLKLAVLRRVGSAWPAQKREPGLPKNVSPGCLMDTRVVAKRAGEPRYLPVPPDWLRPRPPIDFSSRSPLASVPLTTSHFLSYQTVRILAHWPEIVTLTTPRSVPFEAGS